MPNRPAAAFRRQRDLQRRLVSRQSTKFAETSDSLVRIFLQRKKKTLSFLFFFRFQLVQFGQSAGRGPLEEGLEVFLALPALALRPLRRVGGREEHLQPAPPAATFPLLVRKEQGRRGGREEGAEDDDEGRARSPFRVAAARRLGLGLGLFLLPDALAESFVAPRLARLDIPLTCPPGAQYGPVGGPR